MKEFLHLLLLIPSNAIMVAAWYLHLKYIDKWGFWQALFISWGIAFFEYFIHVYAHRQVFSTKIPVEYLKMIQEAVHLIVFFVIAAYFFPKFQIKWNHIVAMIFVVVAVGLFFFDEIR